MLPAVAPFDDENEIKLSPNYQYKDWRALKFDSDEDWERGIQMFEDRMEGRFFNLLRKIEEEEFAGFVILAIDCLIIETLQQFYHGAEDSRSLGGSGPAFCKFLANDSVFFNPHFSKRDAGRFYSDFRCGILHQAEVKENALVKRMNDSKHYPLVQPTSDGRSLIINRTEFHNLLVQEYKDYVRRLREDKNKKSRLCTNFRKKMNHICRVKAGVP